MKFGSAKQREKSSPKSKREMVLWDGGIYFGGMMASITFGVDLIRNTENFMPSRSPAALVWFSWIWMLVVNPLFWFGAGCLFGFVMWKLQNSIKTKPANRNE